MAGGSWTIQNKARPGAYVNFEPVTVWSGAAGRGVATMPLTLDWGPEETVIPVTQAELLNGSAAPKVGYSVNDDEALLLRECLKHCARLLVYRLNSGGASATATLGNLSVTARYGGVRGNDLAVAVSGSGTSFTVRTYVDGVLADEQTAAAVAGLRANDWVTFSGSGSLTAVAATALSGGSNGAVAADAYNNYFEAMKTQSWQVMGIPSADATLPPLTLQYIRLLRETLGKKVQAVVYNYSADYEGIISSKQGYSMGTEVVTPTQFVAWVTGLCAGATVDESNTYARPEGATAVSPVLDDEAIETALEQGFFVLARRTDGQIVVEQDINTLRNEGGLKSNALKKNRVIRTLDDIAATVCALFENNYLGRVDNNEVGRTLFKDDIVRYCGELADLGAIGNFAGADDVTVTAGNAADSVVAELAVQPVDAMEKLYMTVEVQA